MFYHGAVIWSQTQRTKQEVKATLKLVYVTGLYLLSLRTGCTAKLY